MSARHWIQGWLSAAAALHGRVPATTIQSLLADAGFEGPKSEAELRSFLAEHSKTLTVLLPYLPREAP